MVAIAWHGAGWIGRQCELVPDICSGQWHDYHVDDRRDGRKRRASERRHFWLRGRATTSLTLTGAVNVTGTQTSTGGNGGAIATGSTGNGGSGGASSAAVR